MPIFRTLIRTLIRDQSPRSHTFSVTFQPPFLSPYSSSFSSSSSPSAAANPFTFILRLTSSHSRLFSPLSLFVPFSGPLFLSPTPWKLSQSATPLYLRGKDVAFPKDLLRTRTIPVGLGLRGDTRDKVWWKRRSGDDEAVAVEAASQDKFLNLPNLISISRGISGPFIGWMIMNEWYFPAFVGLAVSGATDWLDGFIARRMGINSVFGSYLDPLADKVLIGCVALAMVKQDLLHPGLVGLVVFRDVALVSGAVYKRASSLGWEWKSWSDFVNLDATHREKVEPLLISKVNTVFQLLLVAGALLQPEFGTEGTRIYVDYLSWLVASTTVASSAAYTVQHLRNRSAFTIEKRLPSSNNKLS